MTEQTTKNNVDPREIAEGYNNCYKNYVDALSNNSLDGIVATFSRDCSIQVYDKMTSKVHEYKGLDGVKKFFSIQLKNLTIPTDDGTKIANITIKNGIVPNGDTPCGWSPGISLDHPTNSLWSYWSAEKTPIAEYQDVVDTFCFTTIKNETDGTVSYKIQNLHQYVKIQPSTALQFPGGKSAISSLIKYVPLLGSSPKKQFNGKETSKVPIPNGYKQVFFDDFETLDKDIWKFDLGKGFIEPEAIINAGAWGNQEFEYYTDSSSNVFVKDSVLYCRALKDEIGAWTSSRLTTRGTFEFTFGRFEARVRCKVVDGPFSAVWALSEKRHNEFIDWPRCGEIDIFEMQTRWRNQDGTLYTPATLHFQDHHGGNAMSFHDTGFLNEDDEEPEWHVYAAEWTPDSIEFFHDGKSVGRYNRGEDIIPNDGPGGNYCVGKTEKIFESTKNWPYTEDNPFYLIINNSMGAGWGTPPKADLAMHDLEVDWVRVLKKDE